MGMREEARMLTEFRATLHFRYEGMPYFMSIPLTYDEAAEGFVSENAAIQLLHDRMNLDMDKIQVGSYTIGM